MITADGWTTGSAGNSNCLQARRSSTLQEIILFRESHDPFHGIVMVSTHRWSRWLERVRSGEFMPEIDAVSGELVLAVSDFSLLGAMPRPVRTTSENWEIFRKGVLEGVFDHLVQDGWRPGEARYDPGPAMS